MTIESGARLGPYEVLAPIGAGGMGEVYKAKDTRLDRTVAIKVLLEHLADHPERKARFEREAKAISQLNHPHICTLYDVGEQDGTDFIVMEHIEGETLGERLKKGALKLDQALEYGIQIADGLEKAHRAGIVHRDLKPGNVMLTKSGVKLLDFGLAKLVGEDIDAETSDAPTQQRDLTKEQAIIGTLQYMTPEQLERKPADTRTDIFAFGALMHEMLTGEKAFKGDSQASLIAAILEHEPMLVSNLQPTSPRALDRVVRKCLAKQSDARWQSAADLRDELVWIEGAHAAEIEFPSTASTASTTVIPRVLGSSLIAALVAGLSVWSLMPSPSVNPVTRLTVQMDGYDRRNDCGLTISPDGRTVVYVAERDGVRQLYARRLNQLEPEVIPGTEGAESPFYSPDGEWIGFTVSGSLKKIALRGGSPTTFYVGDIPDAVSASWSSNDTVVFDQSSDGVGLFRVSASGSSAETTTNISPQEGETYHARPEMLPGGRAFLFEVRYGQGETRIAAKSLESGERRDLLEGGNPRYSSTGHIVFAREASLWAVPFDYERLEITGADVPVVENVRGLTDRGQFALSANGTLIYANAKLRERRQLVWVDRSGEEEPLPVEPDLLSQAQLSPDGRRIAAVVEADNQDIWIYDLASNTKTRLTFDPGLDRYPLWTPDSHRVVWSSGREGVRNLFWRAADGTGQVERLTKSLNIQSPWDWSVDGKTLVFQEVFPDTGWDIRALSMGDRESKTLIGSARVGEISGAVSPDGKFIAYTSFESTDSEIWVCSFPNANEGRWQIASDGGDDARWMPDGRELIYHTLDAMIAVPIETEPTFRPGKPEVLFEWNYFVSGGGKSYDISPDGKRFLMIKELDAEERASTELVVVLNWFEELKRLVPTDK